MINNNVSETITLFAMNKVAILNGYGLPCNEKIDLPENTNHLEVFEYVGGKGSLIQKVYIGRRANIKTLLEKYGNCRIVFEINESLLEYDSIYKKKEVLYTVSDGTLFVKDILDKNCITVDSLEELNAYANALNEQYKSYFEEKAKVKKLLFR